MNQVLGFFLFLFLIAGFAFKNNTDKPAVAPRKDINADSAKKMMNQYLVKGKKEDHSFTKFSRKELIEILESMDVDTVKFVMGAYLDDVKGAKRRKPVIMMQIKTTRLTPGGADNPFYSYLEGALCPPPDSPPCSALLEN